MVDEELRENFRISKNHFVKFCSEIRPFLLKKMTNTRKPVSVEKQVAVALNFLADEGRFCQVANALGSTKCTVAMVVRKVCSVISTVMGPRFIMFPKTERDVLKAVEDFYEKHGFETAS